MVYKFTTCISNYNRSKYLKYKMPVWIDFKSGCPTNCGNEKKDIQWRHGGCILGQELNEDAILRCKSCNRTDLILNWKFSCSFHQDEYIGARATKLTWALSLATQLSTGECDKAWVKKLASKIVDLT